MEPEALCANGLDDDGDGAVDCDDDDCACSRCGNGVTEPGEVCDAEPGCTDRCTFPSCGDGFVDGIEQCDDGNVTIGDGCDASCLIELCGNGVFDDGEDCDDDNRTPGDGCDEDCRWESPPCGNGTVDLVANEECDDGNTLDDDGCDAECRVEYCGDGIVHASADEECDDGNDVLGDGCSLCREEHCGDGRLVPGEECDDGNPLADDGCDAACVIEYCGDAIVQSGIGEGCDDGDDGDPLDACHECEQGFCGDSVPQAVLGEECDDGNDVLGDGCAACRGERCGDGIVLADEECDDGDLVSNDGCDATCVIEFCGDGILHVALGEECDDGNDSDPLDGCDDCERGRCGDGLLQTALGEECDDDSILPGDGCGSFCRIEECGDGVLTLEIGEFCDGTPGCSSECTMPEYCVGDLCFDVVLETRFSSGRRALRDFLPGAGDEVLYHRLSAGPTIRSGYPDVISDFAIANNTFRTGFVVNETTDIVTYIYDESDVFLFSPPLFEPVNIGPYIDVPLSAAYVGGALSLVFNHRIQFGIDRTVFFPDALDRDNGLYFTGPRLMDTAWCGDQFFAFRVNDEVLVLPDAETGPADVTRVEMMVVDGEPRLLAHNSYTLSLHTCALSFETIGVMDTTTGLIRFDAITVGDVDGDGEDDAVVTMHFAPGRLYLSTLNFAPVMIPGQREVLIGDINGDGLKDLTFESAISTTDLQPVFLRRP